MGRVIAMASALSLLVCTAFQAWRPFFFLTHDNVTQWLPPMVEIARHLQADRPAFVSESLFGGNYDWSTDATIFPLISPLLPLLSPLARTAYYFALVDIITTFEFVVIAIAFAASATWLRRRHDLPISDGIIVATTLSYAFAPLFLLYGTSWMGFINVQAAWPLVFVALQFRSALGAIGLIFGAFVFCVFGGNLHPFFFLICGSMGWAAYFYWRNRSIRPLLCLVTSLMLLSLLIYLVIGPGLETIGSSGRIRSFSATKSTLFNVPPLSLAASIFLGPFSESLFSPWVMFGGPSWGWAIAYSAVNLPTTIALARGGWRDTKSRSLLVAVGLVMLFVWRPVWLADLITAIPVLRSTRWPFRELAILLFHVHLLFLFNYRPLPRFWNRLIWSVALFPMVFLFAKGPPSMGPAELSRRLILSGVADEYWKTIRPVLIPRKNLVCADLQLVDDAYERAPFPLLPSHNFASLFGVVSVSGYSTTTPLLLDRARLVPPAAHGIYSRAQAKVYLEHFPDTRLTVLHQVDPPIWSIYEDGLEKRLTLDPETLFIRTVTGE